MSRSSFFYFFRGSFFLILALFYLGACGQKSAGTRAAKLEDPWSKKLELPAGKLYAPAVKFKVPEDILDSKKYYNGEIVTALDEFYKEGEYLEPCDIKWKDQAYEIASYLDEHENELNEKTKSLVSTTNRGNFVTIGPYQFIKNPAAFSGKDSWDESKPVGWAQFYKDFQSGLNNKDDGTLISLNSYVRGRIHDYRLRIMYGIHPQRKRELRDSFLKMKGKIAECYNNTDCLRINLDSHERSLLTEGLAFKKFLADAEDVNLSRDQRRSAIKDIFDQADIDFYKYGFTVNNKIKFQEGTLLLPLDMSVFGSNANLFAAIIEKHWSIGNHKLKLVNTPNENGVFKVLIEDVVGARSEADSVNKLVKIHNYDLVPTLVHELGHVLGLKDTYFTLWDKNQCGYYDQFNGGDVMSDTSTGKILESHWKLLLENYSSQK